MNLRGVTSGDIVRLAGDPSLWTVRARQGRFVDVYLTSGSRVRRRVSSYEVEAAWKRLRRA